MYDTFLEEYMEKKESLSSGIKMWEEQGEHG